MINVLLKVLSLLFIIDKPEFLPLKTYLTQDKTISIEKINSEDFVENKHVNAFSGNGYLWVETEIPSETSNTHCDFILLGQENIFEAELYVFTPDGRWQKVGTSGIGLPLRKKSIPSILNAYDFNSDLFRTEDSKTIKIRFKVSSSKDSLFEAYYLNQKSFEILNFIYASISGISIGFCIITILYILFCSITFQDSRTLILMGASCCLFLLFLFKSKFFYAFILAPISKPHELYKIYYLLLNSTAMLICTYLHKSSKLGKNNYPSWRNKFVNGSIYFFVSVATVGMLDLFLPVSYQNTKFIELFAFTATFACESFYSYFTWKYDKSSSMAMLWCFKIALLLLWLQELFLVMRFLPFASRTFRIFDNSTFFVPIISFLLIGISTLIQINRRVRNNLAFLQINTAEANEKVNKEKRRSYVYNCMASMLANPLQALFDSFEKTKDIIPPEESILFQHNIQYASKIVKAISTISTYEHDNTEIEINREPVDLAQLVSQSISAEVSTLQLNGCYTNILENYADGSYVMANKDLLSISLQFLMQAVVSKTKPKSTVQISSEYEKLTFIFSISFDCDSTSIDHAKFLFEPSSAKEITEPLGQLAGRWGMLIYSATRILNLLSGKLILTPTFSGMSIQIRIALKTYTPDNTPHVLYDIDEFNEEEEKQTFILSEKPKYNQTTFIVEEDQTLRTILNNQLHHLCNIKFFATNIDLFRNVEAEKPDLILYSLTVPGENLTTILERHPDLSSTPLLVTAKFISKKTISKLYDLGVVEIIQKPYMISTLAQRLEAILRNRSLFMEKIFKSITDSFRNSLKGENFVPAISSVATQTAPAENDSERKSDFSKNELFEAESMALFTSAGLTKKETLIANLIASGKTDKEIAAELGISTGTVAVHNKNLYKKLNIHSRTELIEKLHKQ